MIDLDSTTSEVLMPAQLAMQFLVWAVYYNDLELKENVSFAEYGKFSSEDVARLNRIKQALFKCFDQQSVDRSSEQMRMAKRLGERCPFLEEDLNRMFGTVSTDAQ